MVEGARLESVFRGNSNEGSNPSLSATNSFIFKIKKQGVASPCQKAFLFPHHCRRLNAKALNPRPAHFFAIQKKGREDDFFLEVGFVERGF